MLFLETPSEKASLTLQSTSEGIILSFSQSSLNVYFFKIIILIILNINIFFLLFQHPFKETSHQLVSLNMIEQICYLKKGPSLRDHEQQLFYHISKHHININHLSIFQILLPLLLPMVICGSTNTLM